jgi:hypothetical protein
MTCSLSAAEHRCVPALISINGQPGWSLTTGLHDPLQRSPVINPPQAPPANRLRDEA